MDIIRNGNFTSSKISCLNSKPTAKAIAAGEIFGAAAKTYIRERNYERKLGRSISTESTAHPLTWGKIIERYVFNNYGGIRWVECSQISIKHPTIDCWVGSPDYTRQDADGLTVGDIKGPATLKSFCDFMECVPMVLKDGVWIVDPEMKGYEVIAEIRENHDAGDDYYFQLVSNAILTGAKFCELTIFCPYFNELTEIKALAQTKVDEGESGYWWIAKGADEEMPYLLESGRYNNLNVIRWEVSELDKKALETRVIEASKLLIEL